MPVTEVPPLVSRDSGSRARRPVRITRLVMCLVLRYAKPETISGLRTSQGNRAWEDCTAGRARAQGKRLFKGWVRAGSEAANTARRQRRCRPQLTWFRTVREESRTGFGWCGGGALDAALLSAPSFALASRQQVHK